MSCTYDASTQHIGTGTTGGAWVHTTGAGSNQALIVLVRHKATRSVPTLLYNRSSSIPLLGQISTLDGEYWGRAYGMAGVVAGPATIYASGFNSLLWTAVSISVTGALSFSRYAPVVFGDVGSSNLPSLTLPGTITGNLVLNQLIVTNSGLAITGGGSGIEQDLTDPNVMGMTGYDTATGPSWSSTPSPADYLAMAVVLKSASDSLILTPPTSSLVVGHQTQKYRTSSRFIPPTSVLQMVGGTPTLNRRYEVPTGQLQLRGGAQAFKRGVPVTADTGQNLLFYYNPANQMIGGELL